MSSGRVWGRIVAVLVSAGLVASGLPAQAVAAPTGGRPAARSGSSGFLDSARGLVGARGGGSSKLDVPKNVDLHADDVPRSEPAAKAVKWGPAKRVKELTGRRTANTKFFQLSDGRTQAEVSTTPVHYRDAKGRFQPIDTTVGSTSRSGFVKGNTTNAYTSLFGGRTDRLVRFEADGRFVELGLTGPARAVTPKVDGSTVTFAGVAGGADLVYEVTPRELREKIVLAKAPADGFSVAFTVKTGGVQAQRRDDGSIAFVAKAGGESVFTIPAPYMYDAGPDSSSPNGKGYSSKVTQTVSESGSTATVTVTADAGWLAEAARTYPVTIDPTIRIVPVPADAQDVEIYSGNTTKNYNDTYQLKVGTDASQSWRTLVRFPLTGVPAGTQLDDAQLQLYYDQTHTTWEYDVALQAHRVTQPWTESTATWANMSGNFAAQPAGNMVTVDDGDSGTSVSGSWPTSTNPDLTPLAINGDYRYNNDGVTGSTHTWVPTITEAGNYQVEVHFVSESDRPTNAPYTVYYNGGSKTYTVNQSGSAKGVWKTLGVHPFAAGTTGKVVLGDVANKAVIADAVRFTKWGAATKPRAVSSAWTSFPVRNVVQDWINAPSTNNGFMIKAVDEATKGRGGPVYEASEYAYLNNRRDYNLPRLVLTFGRQGTTVNPPTTITSTGAALTWPAYVDPTGPNGAGDDIVEYQVHRSIYQTYTPSAATLVAPVSKSSLAYQDTTAIPTPTDEPDPLKRHFYYYMVAVKTADGQVLAGPTQGVLLPKAGQITKLFRETAANQVPDTTLSAGQPNTNVNVYDGDPYVSPGNNSTFYGDTRGLVKFGNLSGVPASAQVVNAQLQMWTTTMLPGGSNSDKVDVHRVTRAWDETTATWTKANASTSWTTAGGDYDATAMSYVDGLTNDPEWEAWDVTSAVKGWLTTPSSNNGLLVKMHDEAVSSQRVMLLASEASEPLLRPTLQVTYLELTPESTYYAGQTPALMTPTTTYQPQVTVSNPTTSTWTAANWELSYKWRLPDGTDVSNASNQVTTPLPEDISPGETVDISAQVKSPASSADGNKRTDYSLEWELHNKTTGQWLSSAAGIAPLAQKAAVEEPTSDQLGLEQFYAYTGTNTGAGSTVMDNLYAGNAVWSYNAFTNPSRGLSTFVRMAYNSLDTSDTVAGYGWSLQASSLMRLGTLLDFHPNPHPTTVKLTDGDGTTHTFSLDDATQTWISPKGVHLYLRQFVECKPQTEESRAWSMLRPDRTEFFFDCDGYLSSIVDKNGNTMTFTYEVRRSQNKPTKFLRYVNDATGRQTLTVDYWAKGDTYDYIDDTTWQKVTGATNLTNPHIIDHIRSVTDISGRKLTFTYTDKGLLGELIDGAGSSGTMGAPKVFKFQYDMTQGNKNVKLVKVTDPRNHATTLDYYSRPEDDPQFKWELKTITDRLGFPTSVAYTDPDGPQGNTIHTLVTDAENHGTLYKMDGFGRPVETTNALDQTTKLQWDDDHNVKQLTEANGAVSTWKYDPKTGYPTEIKDAEAVKNGWPGTTLAYQTGVDGHIADLIAKQTPEGHRWTFGYTTEGDLASVTDPIGNTTADPDDYTSHNTYDTWGQLESATDANGNTTRYPAFHPSGYPLTITDPFQVSSTFEYDDRGNVLAVHNAKGATVTQTYDTFSRPLDKVEPMDAAANRFITTQAPQYDPNDNILTAYGANGAATTSVYDNDDRVVETLAPKDEPDDPERKTTTTYDKVGNVVTVTSPQGNLTSEAGDYTTTTRYDAIYQQVEVIDPIGGRVTAEYDDVGNVVTLVDAKKNATTDPDDFTKKYGYDLNHRVIKITDPLNHFTTARYDRDGLLVGVTDAEGNESLASYNPRGQQVESKVPYNRDGSGNITYRTTRYEYDQVGNQTKVITPRGVQTDNDADDFATVTVYDALNRVKELWSAYDESDDRYNTPDKTIYDYDEVGNVKQISAPPSEGQTVRNITKLAYYDNGWTKSETDPWDIRTEYDYNELGQQTRNTLTSAGGSSSRTIRSEYYPSGNEKSRSDDGIPVGKEVVLVDSSDANNTALQGAWTSGAAEKQYGYDAYTAPAGSGSAQFVWRLNIPRDGNYEVFVWYPQVSGAASDAKFTVTGSSGSTTKTVNQSTGAGAWVSLGTYAFTEDGAQTVRLTDQANGRVVADAVKLVRDNTGEPDTEEKEFTYKYNPNGMMVEVKDLSPGAKIDTYQIGYDELDRVKTAQELAAGSVKNTTTTKYDPNSNPIEVTHDLTWSLIGYDERDMVASVTNADSPTAGNRQVSTFTYTSRGELKHQVKPNGNTVDLEYYLDGSVKHQVEKRSGGAVVAEHSLEYEPNGNRSKDVLKLMNADNSSDYIDNTYAFDYDPQDRIEKVTKSGDSSSTETYEYDANSNVISQTVGGVTTTNQYDRNRLHKSTTAGVTSTYNYDPLGRLDTVSVGGQRAQKYYYDGFDRTAKMTAGIGETAKSTTYVYDPFDRTQSQTAGSKTTAFTYLGMDSQVLREDIEDGDDTSYQYAPWAQKLTQIKHKDDGSPERSQYVYHPHGDVEAITKDDGTTRSTYGYTAYGKDDESQYSGEDKPDTGDAGGEEDPYNAYRFNSARFDAGSGTYDMGFRNYDPGLNRFLTRDMFAGALADMALATDPFTGNRYSFAGGNPISFVELTGHLFGMSWSDLGHAALDVVGLVPVVGEVADVANGIWYAAEGNYVDAALSLSSAIPLAGYGATAIKAARTGSRIVDAVDTANDIRKAEDRINDARKLTDTPAPRTPDAPKSPDVSGPKAPDANTPKAPDADAPKAPTKCNSFVPGTRVLLADGGSRPIEQLAVGDWVAAEDVESGDGQSRVVTEVRQHAGTKSMVTLTVDVDGSAETKTGQITSTAEHEFWLPDVGKWVLGKQLKPGMWLQTAAGTWVQITAIAKYTKYQEVHNLTVDSQHDYYVFAGDTPVLVHNCGGTVDGHRTICDCANGGPPVLKRGPKPFGTGAHNLKIADVAGKVKDGKVIAGGQIKGLREAVIPTPGGFKSTRRPDILVQRPDGSVYGINVGRQRASGAPVKREAEALWDLEGAGIEMHFVAYN